MTGPTLPEIAAMSDSALAVARANTTDESVRADMDRQIVARQKAKRASARRRAEQTSWDEYEARRRAEEESW